MRLPMHALLICAGLLPATGALAASPEWDRCKDIFNKDQAEKGIAACTHILNDKSEQPNYAMALRNRCGLKQTKGDYDGALADCNQAIAMDPQSSIAFERRAGAWQTKGENVKAMSDFNDAIRLDPTNAYALYARGVLKQKGGDQAGGSADIARAKQIRPGVGQ